MARCISGVWRKRLKLLEETIMQFDDDLEMYTTEIDGIVFAVEEPIKDYEENLIMLADKYWSNLDYIVEFMMPDLEEMYGYIDNRIVKDKLGKPTIYPDSGLVDYFEQSFDDMHIFRFEFLDDEFKELQYFQIDG